MNPYRSLLCLVSINTIIAAALPRPTNYTDFFPRNDNSVAYTKHITPDIVKREYVYPDIPPRPGFIPSTSFHGYQFVFFDEWGFVDGSPAVEAAPVYFFSTTDTVNLDPCYPESAVVIGSSPPRPNPGTGPVPSWNPGQWCNDPGAFRGPYTPGNNFPVYVSAGHCAEKDEWRVNYALYFVHSGHLMEGQRHDWESVTVIFKRDMDFEDWWHRDAIIYKEHQWKFQYNWTAIQSVDVDDPKIHGTEKKFGGNVSAMKKHPHVYVGFYTHASFANACALSSCTFMQPSIVFSDMATGGGEYRSTDWWRMPEKEDFHLWSEINSDWNYEKAVDTPPRNKADMCFWDIDCYNTAVC